MAGVFSLSDPKKYILGTVINADTATGAFIVIYD